MMGVEELRLARLVVQHGKTNLDRTLSQISQVTERLSQRLQLLPAEQIEHEITQRATAPTVTRRPQAAPNLQEPD